MIVLHSITVVCPRLLTVGAFVLSVFFVLFNFCTVPLQCLRHDSVTLISILLLTYLLTYPTSVKSVAVELNFIMWKVSHFGSFMSTLGGDWPSCNTSFLLVFIQIVLLHWFHWLLDGLHQLNRNTIFFVRHTTVQPVSEICICEICVCALWNKVQPRIASC